MKVFFWFWLLLLAPMGAFAQTAALTNFCVLGAKQAATSGSLSSNYLQGVIRQCTVTVFLTNTTNKATIYADANNTPLSNPFTANTNGLWLFYAAEGTGYDVKLSGGIPPNTYATPVTLTDMMAGGGGGASPGLPLSSLQYNNAGSFGGANGDFNGVNPLDFTLGNINYTTVTAWSCAAPPLQICTITAPNNFTSGELVYFVHGSTSAVPPCPDIGDHIPVLSTGLSSSQFQVDISGFGCPDGGTGTDGTVASDFAGFTANCGLYGCNLFSLGVAIDPGVTLCAATAATEGCETDDAGTGEVTIEADDHVSIHSQTIDLDGQEPNHNVPTVIQMGRGNARVNISTNGGTTITDTGSISLTAPLVDLSASANLKLPLVNGYVTTVAGEIGIDSNTYLVHVQSLAGDTAADDVLTPIDMVTAHQISARLLCADTSGSGTAQVCNTTPSFTPVFGDCIHYTTSTANSGTGLTINVNSLGAKPVAKWLKTTTLAENDVRANAIQGACYDGTNWEIDTIGNAP